MQYEYIEHRFTLRLNHEDNLLFEEKFQKSGLNNRNEYLRMLIRYGCVYTGDHSYISEYNMQLAAIGRNINQIAHKVNSTGNFYQDDMDYLKGEIEKIWQLQKSMLSKEPLINL